MKTIIKPTFKEAEDYILYRLPNRDVFFYESSSTCDCGCMQRVLNGYDINKTKIEGIICTNCKNPNELIPILYTYSLN